MLPFFKILGLFALSLLVSFGAGAQYITGNPGEGIIKGDKIYLRDLIEAGLEKEPRVGTASRRDVGEPSQDLQKLAADLRLPVGLIQEKLTDVNFLQTGLGDVLAEIILSYQWSLVEEELREFPDKAPVFEWKPDQKVTLANRNYGSIRIERAHYERMDERNRLALIFHEAVSSLLVPRCQRPGICEQSSVMAQEITASLFSGFTCPKGNVGDCLPPHHKYALNVEWPVSNCISSAGSAAVIMGGKGKIFQDFVPSLGGGKDALLLTLWSQRACQAMALDPSESFTLSLSRSPFFVWIGAYPTDGEDAVTGERIRMQGGAKAELIPHASLWTFPRAEILTCELSLSRLVGGWFWDRRLNVRSATDAEMLRLHLKPTPLVVQSCEKLNSPSSGKL